MSDATAPRTHEDARVGQNGGVDGSEVVPDAAERSGGILGVPELNSVGAPVLSGAEGLRTLAAGRIMPDGSRGEHTVAYGARNAFKQDVRTLLSGVSKDGYSRGVQELVAQAKEYMTEAIYQPENVQLYLDAITEGARKKDKTCVRMLHEIYDLAEMKNRLVMEFLARVGMQSLDEVEAKFDRVKNAQEMDAHQRAGACAEYLTKYFDRHPGERAAVMRRMGVEVPLTSESFAVVAEDNAG